jgi:dihydropteroate synthase
MSKTELVGILNITPDSFSDGGLYVDTDKAFNHAVQLRQDGAAYIDVGAESTRPNATPLSADQEWQRLQTLWPSLVKKFDTNLSLDTYHPQTVRRAARFGKFIVNDVTAFHSQEMIDAVIECGLSCIVSHLPVTAGGDVQSAHSGTLIDSVDQVRDELLERHEQLLARGIAKQDIILDPGIGFGKTPETNWALLRFAEMVPDIDVMVGYSRKRFLGDDRMELEPNLKAGRIAITAGTRYLRVHDVAGHRQLLDES